MECDIDWCEYNDNGECRADVMVLPDEDAMVCALDD